MANFNQRFSCPFISLIPKVVSTVCLNDFKPISLLGWVHKLVARVLATRLKGVMASLYVKHKLLLLKAEVFLTDGRWHQRC